jgi:hypothetical protein
LNHWALIKEPGRYEITGTFDGSDTFRTNLVPITAHPISITVLPRTAEEMHDYIRGLTNQIAVRLPIQPDKNGVRYDPALDKYLEKLMYTCSPEMVPTVLGIMHEGGTAGNETHLGWEALLNYAPHTEETRQAILAEAVRHGLNGKIEYVFSNYDFDKEEIKPLIERALAPQNSNQWWAAAALANNAPIYYDDAYATRLIAIASGANTPDNARGAAIRALAFHRTDAGVKTLKTLVVS